MKKIFLGLFLAIFLLTFDVSTVKAGTVYYTSLNATDSTFAKYDTSTNTWTPLNDHFTSTQMAVGTDGTLYSYDHVTNQIDKYNPSTDTWTFFANGPGVAPSPFGNLEITTTGRFLFTRTSDTNLYYTDGNVWNMAPLTFQPNAAGDYDPTTNQYVIGQGAVNNAHMIDVTTFAITSFPTAAGLAGEARRMGSILNGFYYGGSTGNLPILIWDLSNNLLPSTMLNVPSNQSWLSSAADRENSVIYVAHLSTGSFFSLSGGVFTPLANAPVIESHSSLAYVPPPTPIINTPIPTLSEWGMITTAGVLGLLAVIGLFVMRRKKASA